ncbi:MULTISPECIES: VOC family protein [unclassified Tardiphaga]|uniref:VOC family protein n=1 Tax=unclassified Tardiphaga TaxID=2631404 RepID=UPI001FEF2131|nr:MULTISPECIES: VOC family protein [unclassified Tardiphaga]
MHYSGNCEEALNFYVKAIGAKIDVIMHVKGSPAEEHLPPEMADKVLHSQFTIDGEVVMASDAPPAHFEKPQGFSVALQIQDPAEGERIFKALADGGAIKMPYGATFWSKGFGMCIDKFGIPWMVNSAFEP